MRHINIPIFIPHLGCPNQCIFCNQRFISGTVEFDESIVDKQINEVLSSVKEDDECEIAFFGGSFTGIDRKLMISLLNKAQKYVDAKKVVGIRMSTRPDYINDEIIEILKKYSVTCVELGIQSMNDNILGFLKRGHSAEDTVNATRLLKKNGISFVGQMMIGLPLATLEDEIDCAEQICMLGAVGSRIYPTLVFRHTELEEYTEKSLYKPLTVDEAVERSSKVLGVFMKNDVKCIRIGLCDSDNLHSSDSFVGGPNSPDIGEMVKSRYVLDKICEELNSLRENLENKALIIECSKGQVSQVVGNKKKNIFELKNKFKLKKIVVKENLTLKYMEIKIKMKEENLCV